MIKECKDCSLDTGRTVILLQLLKVNTQRTGNGKQLAALFSFVLSV